MFDIKETITFLCKYLRGTVDSTLTPEHFRLAKYNKASDDAINAFWTTLDKLTYYILKEINDKVLFTDFDKVLRTKLRLAFLQYPCMEIYSFPGTKINSSTRTLLIALAWLITKYDVLANVVRIKLLNSALGREFSKVDIQTREESNNASLSSVHNQINNILYKSNKLSLNLKAISELYVEKIKLMTKVHTASITASGLPHLTVSEMSLIKKFAINRDNQRGIEVEKISEMERMASLLDMTMKWAKKNHVFLTWMGTVFDEHEKFDSEINDEALEELAKFIYLLRHLIKRRLKSAKNNAECLLTSQSIQDCPARLLRVQKSNTETHTCLTETVKQFYSIDETLQKKRTDLEKELNFILEFIPNCVQI